MVRGRGSGCGGSLGQHHITHRRHHRRQQQQTWPQGTVSGGLAAAGRRGGSCVSVSLSPTGGVTEDGDSSDWSRSRSDGRSGGKRRSLCSAASQRGTRGSGSGDWGLLLWRAERERDTGLLRDVIVIVFLDNDRIMDHFLF